MISFTAGEVSAYYRTRVTQVLQRGRRWSGPCAIHGGKDNNFSVDSETGLWYCFSQCGRGGDIIALERELAGADFLTARLCA
jgi:DNA primase